MNWTMLATRGLVCAALVALPLLQTNSYWVHTFSLTLVGVILAFGLQLLLGQAGLLSLGQGAFYGIGAYTAASLGGPYGLPFPLALLLGGCAAALASVLLVPIVRLSGSSLAVATLGFGIVVHLVFMNEDWLTGGSIGFMDIPKPTLFGWKLATEQAYYYVCLGVAALVFFALDRLRRSRFGRGLVAMSQDEDAARTCGIGIYRAKAKCFLIAAFTAGLAGGLYAFLSRYLNPNDFTFQKSIDILIMVAVGGMGSLPGAALGAIVVVLLPEYLRSSGEFRLILFGVAVVVLMGAGRGGLAGLLAWVGRALTFKRRPAVADALVAQRTQA
jgi:branched-chain amino acid transport system permease protein